MTTVVVIAARMVVGPGTTATAKRAGKIMPNAPHAATFPARARAGLRG
jgi:hypothetical protein